MDFMYCLSWMRNLFKMGVFFAPLAVSFYICVVSKNGNIVGGILYRCDGKTPFITNGKKAILLCEKELFDATKVYVDFLRELEKNKRCCESAGFHNSGKELEVEPI